LFSAASSWYIYVQIPAPRSNVMRNLVIGKTFDWNAETKQFEGDLPGSMTKDKSPAFFAIPKRLTQYFQSWLAVYRPGLPIERERKERKMTDKDRKRQRQRNLE
jgi:hypothetical protein